MTDQLALIRHAERPAVTLAGGATYQAIIGDDTGAVLPIRTGIQTSPPGYVTPLHSHPYTEILTVLEGNGEAWLEGEETAVLLTPGVTITLPPNRPHRFRTLGDRPLVTYGIHTSGRRVVNYEPPVAGGG